MNRDEHQSNQDTQATALETKVDIAIPVSTVAILVALAGCAKSQGAPTPVNRNPVLVDGSSTVFLISKAVGEEIEKRGTKASVGESGTTGGFRKFCRGEIDVTGASRAIERAEIESCMRASTELLVRDRYAKRRIGSMFSGETPAIGMTMEHLLEAQSR